MLDRRRFVQSALLGVAAATVPARLLRAGEDCHRASGDARRSGHPTPRPGVDASKILPPDALPNDDVRAVFDDARAIPQVLDGIRCHCNCGDGGAKYSLLSCFEADGMARWCEICQGQTRMARRLVRLRRSLDQIRAAIDEHF